MVCNLTGYLLYSHIHLHNTSTNICRNIVNNNDDFNERTNILLYKIYLSYFILERVMFLVCERWAGNGDRLLHINPSSSDHSSTSFSSWPGCSTVGHWGPKALCLPLALNSASCPQLTSTPTDCVLVIFLFDVHLLPLFFRLFTLVYLCIYTGVLTARSRVNMLHTWKANYFSKRYS